jgi:hypothetical protein
MIKKNSKITATVDKFGASLLGSSSGPITIIRPILSHRFTIIPICSMTAFDHFTKNINKVGLDFKNKSLTIYSRITIDPDCITQLNYIVQTCDKWAINFLSESPVDYYKLIFENAPVITSNIEMDYSRSESLTSIITCNYTNMKIEDHAK